MLLRWEHKFCLIFGRSRISMLFWERSILLSLSSSKQIPRYHIFWVKSWLLLSRDFQTYTAIFLRFRDHYKYWQRRYARDTEMHFSFVYKIIRLILRSYVLGRSKTDDISPDDEYRKRFFHKRNTSRQCIPTKNKDIFYYENLQKLRNIKWQFNP